MKPKGMSLLCGVAALSFLAFPVKGQEPAPPGPGGPEARPPAGSGLQTGPAAVPRHWSKNPYPDSIPDGATYYIVVRGDTLWDLSARFLGSPYLWPQIWDQNRYIRDAHWIYPGDPLILPKIALVSGRAGEMGAEGLPEEGLPGAGPGGVGVDNVLYPVSEEATIQCAPYVIQEPEDDSLHILGSEQGADKSTFSDRDILYVDKGSNAGIKAGDVYTLHHASYAIKHPETQKGIGTKIETTGWARVILVQDNSATAVVEQACLDIHAGDYLRPLEKANVPLALRRPYSDRLTPPSGKVQGYVVDIAGDAMIAGAGQLVIIDVGAAEGLVPGNVLSVYRIMYPSVPTSRNVLGELAILTVRDRTAVAKVLYSNDAMMNGDRVELR